jgi:hypothetical protein
MSYIIVLPVGVLTSEIRAKQITRELYNITVPLAVQADYQKDGQVFGIVTHPDGVQCALQVDPGYIIPVHPQANLEKLVSMFPDLSDTERVTLQGYIHTNDKFPFGHIVPSTTTVRTQEEMQALGWFPEDIEP